MNLKNVFVEDLNPLYCPPFEAKKPSNTDVFIRVHKQPTLQVQDFESHWTAHPENRARYLEQGDCKWKAVSLVPDDSQVVALFIRRRKGRLGTFATRFSLNPTDGMIDHDKPDHFNWWVSLSFNPSQMTILGVNIYAIQ